MSYPTLAAPGAPAISTPAPRLTPPAEHALPEGLFPVLPDALDLPFWEGLRREEVLIQRCRACAGMQWTPELLCHRCLARDLEFARVRPRGRVFSWERVHHPLSPALAPYCPYLVLVVELSDAPGVLLLGNHVGPGRGTADIPIGSPVEAVFEHHADYTLLQWRPAG